MKIFKISLFFISSIFILFCTSNKVLTSQKISNDGLEILYGEISKEQLFYDFPEWENNYNSYNVNHSILDSILDIRNDLYHIEIYLGTWCGDSKREVPKFLKIMNEINIISEDKVQLFAVDRKKKIESRLAEINNIQFVATFVIKKNSIEIGRIVEYPEESLEADLCKIISNP